MFDYLIWRGDLSFGNAPLCPIDALIFSMLAYMDLRKVVPADPGAEPVRLSDAVEKYFALPGSHLPHVTGASNHVKLLRKLSESERFGGLRLFAAKRQVNRSENMQFGAISVLLPGQNLFVAYQGTDDTLVGWKEDFMMSYECPVPAQLSAVNYLNEVGAAYPMRRIFTGGHSKGGNLAVYSAAKSSGDIQERIVAVHNNDGPGFIWDISKTPGHKRIAGRIHTVLPQTSVVGMLMEHEKHYQVVYSTYDGLYQHDGFSWQVVGDHFIHLDGFSREGKVIDETLESWEGSLSPKQREAFADALYTVLTASGAKTLSDLNGDKLKSAVTMLKTYSNLDRETRQLLSGSLRALVGSYAKNVADDVQKNDLEPLRRKLERQRKKAEKRGAKKK